MEMHKAHTEKRRRKIIHKAAELVRSVKRGETSLPAWQKETVSSFNIWKTTSAA